MQTCQEVLVIIRKQITYDEIIRLLRDKKELQNYIDEQKAFLSRELRELALMTDGIMAEEAEVLSLNRNPVGMVRESPSSYGADIQQVLDRAAKQRQQRLAAWNQDMNYLMDLEGEMERVWACLKSSSPKHFLILNRLYVKKEKWDNVVYEMNISKTTLSRLRENGLEEVKSLYESEVPTWELYMSKSHRRIIRNL